MNARPLPVDPPSLFQSPAFAQGMIAPAGRTLYVGGQNGVDSSGKLLEGLGAQTEQALHNVLAVDPAKPGALVEIEAIAAVPEV